MLLPEDRILGQARLGIAMFLPFMMLLLTSCVIPVKRNVTIGELMRGQVLAAETGQPIQGARIHYENVKPFEATSDTNGYFVLQPIHLNRIYWMPPAPVDPPPWTWDECKYRLIISASGYLPNTFERERYKLFARTPEELQIGPKDPEYFLFYLKKDK
ncbi:MAG TPA: hypothetical protein DCZ95_19645 [Verrucomicrobia bacterium]|nr:MAG: hypothetical protein A2X46_10870 [Lentisphaerae bacterium GWF2_57_35]HBA86300.1 hypothetical protein [Verrucomicrobiota bacterium]